MSPRITTIVFVSGQGLLRDALPALIETQPDLRILGVESTGVDAVRSVIQARPDVVLIDADLPKDSLQYALRSLPSAAPKTRVVLLSHGLDHVDALGAVRLGVRGLVSRSAPAHTVFKSLRAVVAGEYWIPRSLVSELARAVYEGGSSRPGPRPFNLTLREREVVALVAGGSGNKDIATRLGLSVQTVKHHLTNVFDKTGVSTRLELATFAVAHGLQDVSEIQARPFR